MMNWKHPWVIIPLVLLFSVISIFIGVALFNAVGDTITTKEVPNDNIFCGDITGEGAQAVWERIAEVTQIKCQYMLPKNIVHMIILPIMIIGSITYAALSWFSKKTGILADYTYVHTIVSASVSIMALSTGSIGYMISFILILAAFATPVGAIGIMIFFLGTIIFMTKKIKSDTGTLLNSPRERRDLLSQHRKHDDGLIKTINKMIGSLQTYRNGLPGPTAPATTSPARDQVDALIGALKDIIKNFKIQSEKIRQGESKGITDTTALGERHKTTTELMDKTRDVDSIIPGQNYYHTINSSLGTLNSIENRLNDLNEEYKAAKEDHLASRTTGTRPSTTSP